MGKRGPDKDADEDDTLWARVVETARPLRKGRAVAKVPPVKPKPPAAKPAQAAAPEFNRSAAQDSREAEARAAAAGHQPRPRHRAEARDRAAAGRGAARSARPPRARGASCAEAFPARGARQGLSQRPRHHRQGHGGEGSQSFYEEEERGVLRQSVPHWLSGAEFADLVISFAEAPRRLGGEGALYVRVRKAPR